MFDAIFQRFRRKAGGLREGGNVDSQATNGFPDNIGGGVFELHAMRVRICARRIM